MILLNTEQRQGEVKTKNVIQDLVQSIVEYGIPKFAIHFYQEMVQGLLIEGGKIRGIRTALGIEIKAKSVVLTNGTFLNGLIH